MYSIEQLKAFMQKKLPEKRFLHVLSVTEDAVRLAEIFSLDKDSIERAALLHDCTKPLSPEEHKAICESYGFPLRECDVLSSQTLHAITGALEAKHFYGESDEVFDMILSHTTGKCDMTVGQKIIFLSDFIEKTRTYPICQEIREQFYSSLLPLATEEEKIKVLDTTVYKVLSHTLDHLNKKGEYVHPDTELSKKFIEKALSSLL